MVVKWFETDAPIRPDWAPQSGGKYKVLVTRTLKLSVGPENTRPNAVDGPKDDKDRLLFGVVKEIDGKSLLLSNVSSQRQRPTKPGPDVRVLLNEKTEFLRETGLDAAPAKLTDVTKGKFVYVQTKKQGETLVAIGVVLELIQDPPKADDKPPLPGGNAALPELAKKCKGALVATLQEVGNPEPGPPGASDYASTWNVEKVLRGNYPEAARLSFRVQSVPIESRERSPAVGKSYILISYDGNANQIAAVCV